MRDQTRNKIYSAATATVASGLGYYLSQMTELKNSDNIAQYVPTLLKYAGLTGLVLSASFGASGLLESWLDRYNDSTPRPPRP